METKHFKLTETTKVVNGITLFQIQALQDLPWHDVKKGDLGGWIEKEENLSGNAWVSGNARVFGNARISGNALVYGSAQVSGNIHVYGSAIIC